MTAANRPAPPPPDEERPALPRELVQVLVQFSAVLNKSRAYPAGHPMLASALDLLVSRLFDVFKVRSALVIGVARHHLVVDGAETDPGHAVLRELADRLHRHQLAALRILPGVEEAELADFLGALAGETWRQGKPLGLEPSESLEVRWPRIHLEPIPLHQLELGDADAPAGEASRRAEHLWQGLVHLALLGPREGGEGGDGSPPAQVSGAEAARAIRERRGDESYSRAVMDWMVRLGDQLGDVEPGSEVHQRVAELFNGLDPDTLQNLMALGATMEKRREVVFKGARALPVKAVLDLLQAAARASNQDISHSLLRILAKLASHLDSARGAIIPGAESALRDSVRQLVGAWDPTADQAPHRQLLELFGRPLGTSGTQAGRATAAPLRLAQLGLEIGADTAAVAVAIRTVVASGDLAEAFEMLDRGAAAGLDMSRLRASLCEHDHVRVRLVDDATDPVLLHRLLDEIGDEAAFPLLEALEAAESASRRKAILQRLERLGARLGPILVARLPDKPWFVQRNLLSLLGALPELPAGFRPTEYARHENARVRREAYKILFARPAERGGALVAAASDSDAGIALMALVAAADQCPAELANRLPGLLSTTYRDPEVRAAGIRLLGARPSNAARDWLLDQVVTTRGWLWFKRESLRPRSAELLAALPVLARSYARHARVQAALRLAQSSADPEVSAAAQATG